LDKAGIQILDDQPSNIVLEADTGQAVPFDPGEVVFTKNLPIAERKKLGMTQGLFVSDPFFFYLWKISQLNFDQYGATPIAKERTLEVMSELGQSGLEIFDSLYGLNKFKSLEPEMYQTLLGVTKEALRKSYPLRFGANGENPKQFIQALESFEPFVRDFFKSPETSHEEKLAMASLMVKNGLPGRRVLQEFGITRSQVLFYNLRSGLACLGLLQTKDAN
jgi:hypothetical protein